MRNKVGMITVQEVMNLKWYFNISNGFPLAHTVKV